jgi:hypothetical protein
MKSKILRSTYTYDPYSQEATLAHLKIEVNLNENRSLYPTVPVPILVPNENAEPRAVQVQSYDLDEVLGTNTWHKKEVGSQPPNLEKNLIAGCARLSS